MDIRLERTLQMHQMMHLTNKTMHHPLSPPSDLYGQRTSLFTGAQHDYSDFQIILLHGMVYK